MKNTPEEIKMNWKINGYGDGFSLGYPLAVSHNIYCAADIAKALAKVYTGQWFGVQDPDGALVVKYRVSLEETIYKD